mgnify:CR=1 FL=1
MKIKEEGWVRQFLKVNAAMALAVLTGCVSAPITEPAVQIHPDVEPLSTGIQSADVRTLASKLCPEILASSIVTGSPPRLADISAASMNAIISSVSSGDTGATPVLKNFTISLTSG